MATFTTPDWPKQARELSIRTGVPEKRVLEIMASKIATALATADHPRKVFHLGRDLDAIEARIRQLDA